MNRTRVFRVYLCVVGIVMFAWWTMGHWVYPAAYHDLLGFESYDLPAVRIIGTLSLFGVFAAFAVARNPKRNRDFFITLLAMSALMSATYLYLIVTSAFPRGEYFNIGLLLVNAIVAIVLYPRRQTDAPCARIGG